MSVGDSTKTMTVNHRRRRFGSDDEAAPIDRSAMTPVNGERNPLTPKVCKKDTESQRLNLSWHRSVRLVPSRVRTAGRR